MKIILVSLMMILTATNSTFSLDDNEKFFSIYLLPSHIKSNQLAKLDLQKLKPVGKPFIHQNDIHSYNRDTHELRITNYFVREKLLKTKLIGKTFAVFVGDEAIFVGAFWSSILSQSFNGIIINVSPIDGKEFPNLNFELGYPSEKFFNGNDLRFDPRIMKAFERVGKVYENLDIIAKCKSLKGTGKRHQSYIFTFEIVSILKGKFDQNEVGFELYMDFGGKKMLQDLETDMMTLYESKDWNFAKNKEFILHFEKRVGRPNPKYHWIQEGTYGLISWEVKN